MKFNPLKEKGIPMEKQLRTWCDIAGRKYNKNEIDTILNLSDARVFNRNLEYLSER